MDAYDYESKSMDTLEHYTTKGYASSQVFSDSLGYGALGAVVNPRVLKSIYQSEDWVYILVDRIASKLAQIPWQVNRETTKNGELVLEPAINHPVQGMIDNPNPLQNSYGFKYSCIVDHTVTGNCVIFHAPFSNWLVQVPVEMLTLDIDPNDNLRGYMISGVDPTAFPAGGKLFLNARDVIHVKRPNASSAYWGLSPIIPGANAILFNKYSNEFLVNFYKKGAQPGMVLEMTEEASADNAKKLLHSIETSYSGRTNQRRAMLLPKGVKVADAQHTLADQQLIEYIRNNRETLINMLGVPKHELSIAESGSLGSQEYKTALKNFWEGPLMSIGSMFESALTQRLKPQLGKGYLIKLNYSNVPVLQEDLSEKANVAQTMLATMTYNEVRQRIWKLPPIPGGDVLRDMREPAFPSFGGQPQASLPPKPASAIQEPTPALPETAAPETKSTEQMLREQRMDGFTAWLKSEDSQWIRDARSRIEDETAKASDKLQKRWMKLLEDQIVESVKVMKRHLGEKASIPNKRQLRREIDAAMDTVEDEWKSGYQTDLAAQIELGYDSVLEVPFNQKYRDGIEAIRARNRAGRRETLAARAIDSFDQISKTTSEKIMSRIEAGMENNESITEIAKAIAEIGANAAGRAYTIARTEAMIANSIGQAAAMKDAAEVIPNLVKVWINMEDALVRGNPNGKYPDSKADHWDLGMEIVPYSKNFSNGLAYPRDTKGPAHEVINCRCSMLTVSEDDLPRLGIKP